MIAVEDGTCGIECVEAPKPLGDVFESVAGAIFVDSGLDIKAVWKVYYPMLKKFIGRFCFLGANLFSSLRFVVI